MNKITVSSIQERYKRVNDAILETAQGCGRSPKAVKLVVVSKSQPLEVLRAAAALGINRFGENYVEEAVEKIFAMKKTAVEWHMIGHIQSRKAELVATNFSIVHSLDSVKLARRLDRFCKQQQKKLPVLLEFNVSGEESKFGIPAWDEKKWPNLDPEIQEIMAYPELKIQGLMTMPPYFEEPEQTRPYFRRLRRLQEFLMNRHPEANWEELSMGTSVDYLAAIQEGATFVRIGQAILGARPK